MNLMNSGHGILASRYVGRSVDFIVWPAEHTERALFGLSGAVCACMRPFFRPSVRLSASLSMYAID